MADMDSKSQKGLGKGLDALIPGGSVDQKGSATEVRVNLIDVNPHQPRTVFAEEALKELAASIKKHGILQPLVVSPKGDHFELIAGERRLRAAKMAGLDAVPVIVRDAEDHHKLEIALVENVHRTDLNPIDEALAYRKLIEEFNYTQEKLAENVGKSRATVANKIRLLSLTIDMKKSLKEGKITEGHGRALLAIEDPKERQAVFEKILGGGYNVRDVERTAQTKNQKPKTEKEPIEHALMLKQLAGDLGTYLGTKVKIKHASKGGKIEIEYYSAEELARIYQKIKGIE